MKTLTILLLLTVVSVQTFAQQQHKPTSEEMLYLSKITKYKRMKNTGVALTLGGAVLFGVGVSGLSHLTTTTNAYGQTTTNGNVAGPLVAYLLGIGGIGAGIPLWIIGGKSQRKYTQKMDNLRMGLSMDNQQTGFSLTYQF